MKRSNSSRLALSALAVCLFAAVALLVAPVSSGQKQTAAAEQISRVLQSFDQLALDPAEMLRAARESGVVTLQTSRGTFDLRVEPYDVRADNYRAVAIVEGGVVKELPRTPSYAWLGTVNGMPEARVRLVLDGKSIAGVIVTADETFYVESARDFAPAASAKDFVFYAESSLRQTEMGECGTSLAEKVGAEVARSGADTAAKGVVPDTAFAPRLEAEIATEADFEYYNAIAGIGGTVADVNNDITNIMTLADGIYDAQLGVRLRVVFQRVWSVSGDPYTETTASGALTELRTDYDPSFAPGTPPSRDLVHMFTGRALGGGTGGGSIIGIAYRGALCDDPAFSYGISQSRFNGQGTIQAQRVALTAHEIGHNFGAVHPDDTDDISPTPPNCNPSIMNSFVQTTSNFCQFSRDQITSHLLASGGSCLTRLSSGCSYTLSSSSAFLPAAGGAGSVGVTTGAGCAWDIAETATWITPTGAGTGSGTVGFNVAANNGAPRSAVVDIGGQRFTIKQAASATCQAAATQIGFNQTLSGSLTSSDCAAVAPAGEPDRTSAFSDLYTFTARAGQRVKIELSRTATPGLDTFLYLFGPDGSVIASNDDINLGQDTNSSIPVNGFFTLPSTGIYTIVASSFANGDTGSYTLRLSDNSSSTSVAFSSAAYSVSEGTGGGGLGTDGTGFRVITVNRTGTLSEINAGTATVDYATSDGTATRLKDYEQTGGTLVFAPGETSKNFTVFVPDDAFAEGTETVQLTLTNQVGTTLGASTATLTINSNDATSGPSPVRAQSFNTAFFVRQQYLDFLGREPDASGFNFWQGEINGCGSDEPCKEVKRVNVSAAFFVSIEFQETGYLVYRTYKAAYGDTTSPNVSGTVPIIRLNEFLPDTQRIGQGVVVNVGNWQQQLEANKQAYALEFVLRPRFLTAFPLSMTPAQFVDKLNQNAGNVLTQGERDTLVTQLNTTADVAAARAAVLRAVAENQQLRDNEFRRAFVLMQYYGYLRRNPDDAPEAGLNFGGWKFWLDKLNQFNGDYIQAEMVKAYLSSDEYIDRFGTRP